MPSYLSAHLNSGTASGCPDNSHSTLGSGQRTAEVNLPWPYVPRSITSWGQVDRLHGAKSTPPGKPFFLYPPFSMGHVPNLPTKESPTSRASAITATSSWKAITTSAKSRSKMFKKICKRLWTSRSSISAKRIGADHWPGRPPETVELLIETQEETKDDP